MDKQTPLQKGEQAPDFTLKDQNGQEFKLSEHRGRFVLLSFHPLAWTKVCAQQMQGLEANMNTFDSLNTTAVGLSIDSAPTKKAWAASLGITRTRLLADFWPHGGVATLCGIFRDKDGFSERANIVLDRQGNVAFYKVYPISQLPDVQEIVDAIRSLPHAT